MKDFLLSGISFFIVLSNITAQDFQSKHFTIQKLDDGVWALIHKNGGFAICNAGIIDLGDGALVFDAFLSPEPAQEIKKAAFALTGHPVKWVVNSHYHNDHIGGNQIFEQAHIISTERTRELISKFQPEEIAADKKQIPIELEKDRKKDMAKMSPHELQEHIMDLGYNEALARVDDSLRVVLPDLTFKDQFIIHGSRRSVYILSYGEGHTESDAFLWLPREKIAFLGDLLFVQNQPWIGDGNMDHWSAYLDSIARLTPKKLVPGHGPVGTVADIDSMKSYFSSVRNRANDYFKNRIDPGADSTLKSPAPFDEWLLSAFYKANVHTEYKRMSKK
jgi:glyoxylase-like metal-dependent hydrolase (beta-lactamase superfamily II)